MKYNIDPDVNRARGRLGGLQRWGNADPAEVAKARQELDFLLLRQTIVEALNSEHPITHVQRRELVNLLLAGDVK